MGAGFPEPQKFEKNILSQTETQTVKSKKKEKESNWFKLLISVILKYVIKVCKYFT